MNKIVADFKVIRNVVLSPMYSRLVMQECKADCGVGMDYNNIRPGQFVEIRVDDSKSTFLRRPISINYVDVSNREIHLLVRKAGDGTRALCDISEGAIINVVLPLGNGFSVDVPYKRLLLVGGGVGVAPLLYLGKMLNDNGIRPTFLLAAKTVSELLEIERFSCYGDVVLSTDDGSAGHKGLVTENPILHADWDMIYCCGPMPMMKAIARMASVRNVECEVSLENTMACGLGACLCCVEDTVDGHVCVCKEGPVFNIKKLKWF